MSIVFGQRVPQMSTQLAKALAQNTADLDHLLKPGSIPPIDLIPALRYVPERWAGWKRFCNQARERYRRFFGDLVDGCEARMHDGKGNGCFIETILEREHELGMTRDMIG